jgi:hypothetical protein
VTSRGKQQITSDEERKEGGEREREQLQVIKIMVETSHLLSSFNLYSRYTLTRSA